MVHEHKSNKIIANRLKLTVSLFLQVSKYSYFCLLSLVKDRDNV